MASAEELDPEDKEAQIRAELKKGSWFDKEKHPSIRKRARNLEFEYIDSGGSWTYQDWRNHQSWSRYFKDFYRPKHMLSSVFQELPLIVLVVLVTVFAALYYDLYQTKAPGRLVLVSTGYFQPYFYLVIPLSLLLVFKTQVSYSRWWEARISFGDQQISLRNAARLVVAWIWPQDKKLGEDIVRLLAVLAPASGVLFRHEVAPLEANKDLLSDREMRYVLGCDQPPVAVGAMISRLLVTAPIETFERVIIEEHLAQFMSTLSVLGRLSSQPLYLTYTRNAIRNLLMFLLGLPFALYEYMGWATMPAVLVTTLLCATIENTATQIENPLLVLPVTTLTTNTRQHVEATLASRVALEDLENI